MTLEFPMSSLAARQHRTRLGFGFPGEQSPYAARRKAENLNGFFAFSDRQGALAYGPQVGPHPGNRELSKGQQCRPVQIRKSLRGWPHQEAWGPTRVGILIPFIGGESSLNPQTVGRGGLWVKLSDGGLNA